MNYRVALAFIFVSFLMSFIVYDSLPVDMPTHWDSQGEVNDTMPRLYGAFLVPTVSLLIFLLFIFLPTIDPLKKNIAKFRMHFDTFIVVITGFFTYVHSLILFYSLGMRFNMSVMIVPGISVLLIYVGIMLKHSRRNWFLGIRTPWTLSSDTVWNMTHLLGYRLFIASGVIAFFGVFFPRYSPWFIIIPLLASVVIVTVYSYLLYAKSKDSMHKTKHKKKK